MYIYLDYLCFILLLVSTLNSNLFVAVVASLGHPRANIRSLGLEAMMHLLNDSVVRDLEATQTRLAEEGACTGVSCFFFPFMSL